MYLKTLGNFEFGRGAKTAHLPTQHARALLACLVIDSPRALLRDDLADRFWPDVEASKARRSLKTAIWSIRRALRDLDVEPDTILASDGATLSWKEPIDCDYAKFLERCAAGEAEGDAAGLELYGGPFLEGDYAEWSVERRRRAENAYAGILSRQLERAPNIETALRLSALNPYDDEANLKAIDLYIEMEQYASAVAAAERYRQSLAEFGAELPRDLEERLKSCMDFVRAQAYPRMRYVRNEKKAARLIGMLKGLSSGSGFMAVVDGEPGSGKTAFLRDAAEMARSLNVAVHDVGTFRTDAFAVERRAGAAPSVSLIDDCDRWSVEDLRAAVSAAAVLVRDGHGFVFASDTRADARVVRSLSQLSFQVFQIDPLTEHELSRALDGVILNASADLLRVLHEIAAGNPGRLASALKAMTAGGTLVRDGDHWTVRNSADSNPTAALGPVAKARLRGQSTDAQAVCLLLALDPQLDALDVAAVAALGEAEVAAALEGLAAANIVATGTDGGVRFHHEWERAAVFAGTGTAELRRLNESIARRLAQRDDAARHQDRIARHLAAAGHNDAAAHAYLAASRSAWSRDAWRASLDLATQGVRSLEGLERPVLRAELLTMTSRCHLALASSGDALDAACAALLLLPDRRGEAYSEAVQAKARASYAVGDLAETLRALDEVLESTARESTVAAHLQAGAWKAYLLRCAGAVAESLALSEALYPRADEQNLAGLQLRLLSEAVNCALILGDSKKAAVRLAQFNDLLVPAIGLDAAWALLDRAAWQQLAGNRQLAATALDAARAQLSAVPGASAVDSIDFMLRFQGALLRAEQGDWPEVLRITERLSTALPYRRFAQWKRDCDMLRANALLSAGDVESVRYADSLTASLPQGQGPSHAIVNFARFPAALAARAAVALGAAGGGRLIADALEIAAGCEPAPLALDRVYRDLGAAARAAGREDLRDRAADLERRAAARRAEAAATLRTDV